MESEKTKQPSTSAAAATLGFAAVMSAVSGVFNNPTTVTDSSDTDNEDQLTPGNVWNHENLNQGKVRSPKKEKPKPIFETFRDGAMRVEIEIQTKNGKKLPVQSPLSRSNATFSLMHSNFPITKTLTAQGQASRANSLPQSSSLSQST